MAWTGSHHKGAMREHRNRKRAEAEARNAATLDNRRARARLTIPLPEPCGKPLYSKRDAQATAKHRSKTLGRPIYTYRCDHCPGWHLTKKERDAASN